MGTVFEDRNVAADHVNHDPGLNSTEIGNLWNTYFINSLLHCIVKSFLQSVEDKDIRLLLEDSLQSFDQRINMITGIFQKEKLPLPIGLSESEDVDLDAQRLYCDPFYLHYLRCVNRFQIPLDSLNFVTSTRADVLEFYSHWSSYSNLMHERITATQLSKGIYLRAPFVTTSPNADMVKRQNFLTGFLGEKRPLLAQEVSALFHFILPNMAGRFLLTGFRQTARSPKVREYMDRGIRLASDIVDTFGAILEAEGIPVPTYWDTMVTDSTVPPFSDRLMMNKLTLLNLCGSLDATYMMINSFRHDIKANLMKIMPAAGNFAEDGVNIMIENGWLEEPPRTVDRRELVNEPKH